MYGFSREYKILIPIFLLLMTYVSLPPYTQIRFYLLPIICIYLWIKFLFTPYRVNLLDDQTVIFKSILKKTIIYPNEIEKITDGMFSYKIIFKNGRVNVSNLMNRPYELKRAIENLNKNIDYKDIHLQKIEKAEQRNPLIIFLNLSFVIILSTALLFYLLIMGYLNGGK
jgi:hypothetical protein